MRKYWAATAAIFAAGFVNAANADTVTIDFGGFASGDNVEGLQVAPGVTVSSATSTSDCVTLGALCPMIFDSSQDLDDFLAGGGEDWDLIGPFVDPSNPGAAPLEAGNILIVSEDNDSADPDDNADGGTLVFDFDNPVTFQGFDVIDINNDADGVEQLVVEFYDVGGLIAAATLVDNTLVGNRQYTRFGDLNVAGVIQVRFGLAASGAIDNLVFDTGAPVPVPGALPLMAAGLVAGTVLRRRRKVR